MKRPTLAEHKQLLCDLNMEVDNHGRSTSTGRLFERAYESLFWLTVEYLKPEFNADVEVKVTRP